jgi:hypothetical protein
MIPLHKKLNCQFIVLILAIMATTSQAVAQKNKKDLIQSSKAPALVSIDAKLNEWHLDDLQHNKASQISYLIANNDSTLFLVVKSDKVTDTKRLLAGGISFSVNTTGQKKPKETLIFPLFNRNNRLVSSNNSKKPVDPAQRLKEELAGLNEIGVNGFDQILDGKIALNNDYGIRAAAGLDEDGLLVCEYALPMKLLQMNGFKSDIFACQISVNGLNLIPRNGTNTPMRMSGRAGFPMMSSTVIGFEPSEFWILVQLSN